VATLIAEVPFNQLLVVLPYGNKAFSFQMIIDKTGARSAIVLIGYAYNNKAVPLLLYFKFSIIIIINVSKN